MNGSHDFLWLGSVLVELVSDVFVIVGVQESHSGGGYDPAGSSGDGVVVSSSVDGRPVLVEVIWP